MAYRLDLSASFKIHPTFCVFYLKKNLGLQIKPKLLMLPHADSQDQVQPELEAILEIRLKKQGNY